MNKNFGSLNMPEYLLTPGPFRTSTINTFRPQSKKVYPQVNNSISNVIPNGIFTKRDFLLKQARQLNNLSVSSESLPKISQNSNNIFSGPNLVRIRYDKVRYFYFILQRRSENLNSKRTQKVIKKINSSFKIKKGEFSGYLDLSKVDRSFQGL